MEQRSRTPQMRCRASTLEILGTASKSRKVNPKWAQHHQRLMELRDQFADKREIFNDTAHAEVPLVTDNMADTATDSYDRDWALAMASSAQNALYEIEQAINRIKQGTYGICELTGQPIESERLRAIPWTRFSAEAQADLELRGNAGRIQLGGLGSYQSNGTDEPSLVEAEEEPQAA